MAAPSFHLTEIPEEGLSVACEVAPVDLGLTPEEVRVIGDLAVSLDIAMAGKRIDVNGRLNGTFRRQCVRCLKEFDETVEVPLAAEYACDPPVKRPPKHPVSDARPADRQRGEDDGLDEEVYPCAGDRLEVADMLREHVILSIPMQPLCREDCLGLCPECGQDRNETACACAEQGRTNPFAVLRQLQKKSNE
jgi:uncharacterized protein